ncbi:MAG: hypothetical protein ABIP55_01480, partial [Tepidisphaeraceae bacterium]
LIGGTIVTAGIFVHRRNGGSLVLTTVVIMILAQALLVHGYRQSREGRSAMKPFAAVLWTDYPDAVFSALPHRRRHAPVELTLYLNRPIYRAANPPTTSPAGQPQVMIVRQNADDPEPTLPPPWRHFRKFLRDESWWHAFVLPPMPGAPPAKPPAARE